MFYGMESRTLTDELGYLVEAIFKQHFKGITWLLFAAYNNVQDFIFERDMLKRYNLKI